MALRAAEMSKHPAAAEPLQALRVVANSQSGGVGVAIDEIEDLILSGGRN